MVEKKGEVTEGKAAKEMVEEKLSGWSPRTDLGKKVFSGEITDINEILDKGIRIKESEIVDKLLPNMDSELILIGGRPGKGGGKEKTPLRISAKMHRSGRRFRYSALVVVGNKEGIVGAGKGSGKEGKIAVEKAKEKAKLNLIKVPLGCGSWECDCGGIHSIRFKTTGKSGSVKTVLLPAPKGVGLVADDESKKILRLAGIKDVWTQSLGSTSTRLNLIKAIFDALKNLHSYKAGG